MWWSKLKAISILQQTLILVVACIFCACNQQTVKQEETVTAPAVSSMSESKLKADSSNQKVTIPAAWASQQFRNLKLDTLYKPASFTSPTFVEGYFNGDAALDIAFLVINKKTEEKGILLLHKSRPQEYYIIGAGNEVNGMTDLNWVEIFEKIPKGESIAETLVDEETGDILGPDSLHAIVLKTEAINLHVAEACGGGIIYWNKNKYEWMHQE